MFLRGGKVGVNFGHWDIGDYLVIGIWVLVFFLLS